jgi:PAS domain S-box-containing protein
MYLDIQKNMSWKETKQKWKDLHANPDLRKELRPEIFDSWERCYRYNVPHFIHEITSFCSEIEYNQFCNTSKYLIETAVPIMEQLVEFVKGTGFVVCLNDINCVTIKLVADKEALDWGKRGNIIEGTVWTEQKAGTNGPGLCMSLVKPITITSYEHFCLFATPASASYAPIVDNGNLIGNIGMVAPYDRVSHHTLGMVVGAVNHIQSTMMLNRITKYRQVITDSMSDGVMVVDLNGNITYINNKCLNILGFGSTNTIGSNINNIFGKSPENQFFINLITQGRTVTDDLLVFNNGKNQIRCYISCTPLNSSNPQDKGSVIIFRETERIQSIVGKWIGRGAKMSFDDIIGKNDKMQHVIVTAKTAALSNSNVLLLGESGTGKDIIAQAIHNGSPRKSNPYLAINCAAMPRELIASELFGYDDGAFTGAKKGGNAGKFELANQGTLFLDEIGDMPLDLQVSLLRVLEEKSITRLGGSKLIPVNIRIIAATNKNLEEEIVRGRFREDLYYRLGVLKINIPPLRERRDDIPLLLDHFLRIICQRFAKPLKKLTPKALEVLVNYEWKGNIRELQNVLEGAVQLSPDDNIDDIFIKDYLGLENQVPFPILNENNNATLPNEKEQELIILENLLAANRFNKSKTAKALGISRQCLYRRLQKYNLI